MRHEARQTFGTVLAGHGPCLTPGPAAMVMWMFDQLRAVLDPRAGLVLGLLQPRFDCCRLAVDGASCAERVSEFKLANGLTGRGHPRPSRPGRDPDDLVQGGRRRRAAGLLRHRPFPRASDVQGHRQDPHRPVLQDRRQERRRGQRLHQSRRHRLFPARRQGPPASRDGDGGRPHGESAPDRGGRGDRARCHPRRAPLAVSTTIPAASCKSR